MQVEGETVLKFALCYGFRNLQNIVRKIKIGKCDYQFLEVMACPSGTTHLSSFKSSIAIIMLNVCNFWNNHGTSYHA